MEYVKRTTIFGTTFDNDAKLWSGPDIVPLYNPKVSIAHVVLNAMNTYGSKIAQISDNNGYRMTFDEMRSKTIRAAQNLQMHGYMPKQVFGFIGRNSHHAAPIIFGSISIGCPVNTLDPSFGKAELIHMLKITKPVLMFSDLACYDLLKECLTELGNSAKIFTLGGSKDDSEPVEVLLAETHKEYSFIPVNVDGDNDTAMIICSSGTTGLSKGVCLSHAALLEDSFCILEMNDVMLGFSSLYWISGVNILLGGMMRGATRIITTDIFSPELELRLIEQYKVTLALNTANQAVLIMKSDNFSKTDLTHLKYVLVGGSKVPFHVKAELNTHLPNGFVNVGYGMSEIGGFIAIDYNGANDKDTVGQLQSGRRVKIVDEHGNRCGPNVDGEVCFKTNYKFLGYFGNQKATEDLFDAEGYVQTGDIGHFDIDNYLYLVDRKKDILKHKGYQISPSEIEAYLIESPQIRSACIIGIPDEGTELPAAVIVRSDIANISEIDVFGMVADHFADYCKLRGGVYFVDALPTTPSGKLIRRKAKETAIELYNARLA